MLYTPRCERNPLGNPPRECAASTIHRNEAVVSARSERRSEQNEPLVSARSERRSEENEAVVFARSERRFCSYRGFRGSFLLAPARICSFRQSFRAKRAVVPSKTNRSYERCGTSGETVTTVAASYTSMELTWADGIDTPCAVCGGDACDWVQVRDGTRRYGCQECLEALLRYREDTTLAEIPDTPDAVVCQACGEFTLEADTGPTNRCAACAPEDTDALLEQVQAALEG